MPSKHSQQSSLFIRGVVSAKKHASAIVKDGIPPEQLEIFRDQIQVIVQSVERICLQYQTNPENLPVPTYQAYLYLKDLLVQDIPQPQGKQPERPVLRRDQYSKAVRLRGLITFCHSLQQHFNSLVQQTQDEHQQPLQTWGDLNAIRQLSVYKEIHDYLARINHLTLEEKLPIESLPAPSLRAYQWLSFLSRPENLQTHLLALSQIEIIQHSFSQSHKKTSNKSSPPLRVEFYNIPGLFRSQQQGLILKMVVHESFVFAPISVFENLVNIANNRQRAKSTETIRKYADSPEFMQNARQLNIMENNSSHQATGSHQDLEIIFNRVNARYFNNQMGKPQLSWSNSLTFRKFGHYQPSTDSLMISASLDNIRIPEYVLDFAMYHELLHKHLGYHVINSRRISHHTEFRKLERQFPEFEQAQKYISEMSLKMKKKYYINRKKNGQSQ